MLVQQKTILTPRHGPTLLDIIPQSNTSSDTKHSVWTTTKVNATACDSLRTLTQLPYQEQDEPYTNNYYHQESSKAFIHSRSQFWQVHATNIYL